MRDPHRIPIVLSAVERAWRPNPDLRLGQLLANVADDPFVIEDDELVARLGIETDAERALVDSEPPRRAKEFAETIADAERTHRLQCQPITPQTRERLAKLTEDADASTTRPARWTLRRSPGNDPNRPLTADSPSADIPAGDTITVMPVSEHNQRMEECDASYDCMVDRWKDDMAWHEERHERLRAAAQAAFAASGNGSDQLGDALIKLGLALAEDRPYPGGA